MLDFLKDYDISRLDSGLVLLSNEEIESQYKFNQYVGGNDLMPPYWLRQGFFEPLPFSLKYIYWNYEATHGCLPESLTDFLEYAKTMSLLIFCIFHLIEDSEEWLSEKELEEFENWDVSVIVNKSVNFIKNYVSKRKEFLI